MKTRTVTVTEPVEYVDRTHQTASWWDRYTVQPGTYAVTEHVGYLWVRVDAVLEESYRVSRLLTERRAHHTRPAEKTTVGVGLGHSFMFEPRPNRELSLAFGRFPVETTEEVTP